MEVAALVEPLAVALHAVNRSRVMAGESVLVLGAGAIGLGIVACLKARGISQIAVADLSSRRLDIAVGLGANPTLDPTRDNLWSELARPAMPAVRWLRYSRFRGAAWLGRS